MTITDNDILAEFRTRRMCEWCRSPVMATEGHHIIPKGGGRRLDLRINLVALGRSVPYPLCLCHRSVTDGNISQASMFDVVAAREGLDPGDVESVLRLILRLDKAASQYRLLAAANELATDAAKVLYIFTMRKAGKLA